MIYQCKYVIGIEDVGMNNKLTNKGTLKILENAAGRHSETVGYGLGNIEKIKISWVLLGWKVQIISRPNYNEEVTINTWGRDHTRVCTYRDFEIYDEKGNLCVIATSRWTIISTETGKLAEVTKQLTDAYKCESKKVFEEDYNAKIKEPIQYSTKTDLEIMRRDIDVNKHVHNLNYLDFAYEAMPEEIYEMPELNNINIMYKKQIKFHDKITCLYSNENNKNTVAIKSEDESVLHSIIELY